MQRPKHSDQIDAMCTLTRRGNIFFLTLTGHDEHLFSSTLIKEIQSKLSEVRAYAEPGLVLITTAQGEFFSNGLDLTWPKDELHGQFHHLVLSFKQIVDNLFSLPLPTVAAVTGHAAAAGFTFALSHDYVLMSKDKGLLYMSEIDNTLTIPDYFMAVMKSKISSPKAQRELELRTAEVKAEEAVEMGIIDSVHDSPGKTVEATVRLGEKLASKKWNGEVFAGIRRASFPEACNVLGLVVMEILQDKRAESIVEILVENLYTSLLKESQDFIDFQIHFSHMKRKLEVMKSFMTNVHKLERRQTIYHTVKTTLANLRELVYAADDILVDCQIQADIRKDATMYCRFSPSEIVFRHRKGYELKEINKEIEQVENELRSYFTPMLGQITQKSWEVSYKYVRWSTQDFDQSEIIGLTEDTEKIKRWILPIKGELYRVGIVGTGGLGKTTLAQRIFNDKKVVRRFQERIWVSVSQTFVLKEIVKNVLKQLGENESGSSIVDLLHRIQETLKDKNYLIVMDDVWSTDGWWEHISRSLPKGEGCSSSIIITTRNEEVARSMGAVEGRIHRPKYLDDDESWLLFCKVAFSINKEMCDNPRFEMVGKEILKKCGGLPLAIKTLGGLLSTKTHSLVEWKKINDNFRDMLVKEGDYSSIIASLQLSYDELPAHLKHCILCFSIYPEDYEISVEQLVRWWVGESFVTGKDTKTAIEFASDSISELISRCLVEVVSRRGYDGRAYTCKMHNLVRDIIIRVAKEEVFCSFDNGNEQNFDECSRHLGLTSEIDVKSSTNNSKLRALLVMTNCQFRFNQLSGLGMVKSLRVLDLSRNKLEDVCIEDLLNWIISQKRLAYLNLQEVGGLKKLPNSIRKLRNLQLLVLTKCNNLEKLPSSITTLRKLIVLDIGNCPSLQYLPQGTGKLSNLQVLSGFKLSSAGKDGCRLGELKRLTQLRVLRIHIRGKDEIEDDELGVLSELDKLQVLSITMEDSEEKQNPPKLDMLSPPPHLQELYLRNYHATATPTWVNPSSLPELQYLHIEKGELRRMSSNFWGSKEQPWKIEGLCLKYLPRLQVEWETVKTMMSLLRYVEISHCQMLQSFPCEVNYVGVWKKKEAIENEDETIEVT